METKLTKRESAIAQLKYAGYHNDSPTLTRVLIERPASLSNADAWAAIRWGADAKERGMRCGCKECRSARIGGAA